MNANLKALSEQAKTYGQNLTSTYGGYEPVSFMDYYTEKLAELILEESTLQMLKLDYHGTWLGNHLKEHFGVKL